MNSRKWHAPPLRTAYVRVCGARTAPCQQVKWRHHGGQSRSFLAPAWLRCVCSVSSPAFTRRPCWGHAAAAAPRACPPAASCAGVLLRCYAPVLASLAASLACRAAASRASRCSLVSPSLSLAVALPPPFSARLAARALSVSRWLPRVILGNVCVGALRAAQSRLPVSSSSSSSPCHHLIQLHRSSISRCSLHLNSPLSPDSAPSSSILLIMFAPPHIVKFGADAVVTPSVLIELVRDIVKVNSGVHGSEFRRDCSDLVRRISLLTHLFEEIRDSRAESCDAEVVVGCRWLSDMVVALQAAKGLLTAAASFVLNTSSEGAGKKIAFQFQCVTWKLEKALSNIPYDQFEISEEVQEQVELVKAQLRRATERYGPLSSRVLSRALSEPLDQVINPMHFSKRVSGGGLHINNIGNVDHEVKAKLNFVPKGNCSSSTDSLIKMARVSNRIALSEICPSEDTDATSEEKAVNKDHEVQKKPEGPVIPDDFLCPISLELMRDPVIVATGQTFERSYIQRWIDSGNTTCPKTRQKLENLTLTPNYVLRSLISQWCSVNNIEQPTVLSNGKIKRRDGTVCDVIGDLAAIHELVCKLSSRNIDECRNAAAEVRSLSRRSTDNRILLAEAGAIPILVNLLTADDELTRENAVTSILNLSIFEDNKELIMLAGAVPSIVQVLRRGSMEARENAAATLFSLSIADENKIIIGASGAIQALVELLQNGSLRGKKDAATALFNLCIYQGNRGRAVRAGIITALLNMLTDSTGSMVDEALTILSILASHQEAKAAIVKASIIPVMIDLMRTGQARIKENTASILLSLCKRDNDNLAAISRLGAYIPLSEIAKSGTERAKRKATSLLELLRKMHHA